MQQKMDLLVARAAPFLRLTNCLCPRGMGVSPVLKGDEATIGAREERETREDSPTRPSSLRHFTYVAELPGPNTCLLPANNAVLEKKRFRRVCALAMIVNRSPYAEALSAQAVLMVNELLPHILPRARVDRRQDIVRLQTSLCHLGILDEPVIFVPKGKQAVHPPTLWQNDPTVDPTWLAWVCAFYEQTPHQIEKTLRETCCYLIITGRWLKETHPEIAHPSQWSEALAAEYVTYTCQALRGDYMSPSHHRYAQFQETPQKLSPAGMNHRLQAMRVFFSTLQRRGYTVDGSYAPKLALTWLPNEAFKTPDDIRAASQPNPRDIAEDTWFKLIWAACTLSKEHLVEALIFNYPLAFYRAASLLWVTAARRMDEIRRLSVGCVRREWVPEMRDEQGQQVEPAEELCYLRVPTNKLRVMRDFRSLLLKISVESSRKPS